MKIFTFAIVFWLALPAWAQLFFVDKKADGQDTGVDSLRGAYALGVSPDGKHIYAPGSLDHALLVFSTDQVTGELTFVEAHVDGQNGITSLAGCRAATVSPDGKQVYAASLTDSTVTVFSRDAGTGALTFVQAIFDLNTGGAFDGLGGAMSVVVSSDGLHVYVGARSDDAIVAFSRNAMTGVLTLIAVYFNNTAGITGLDAPESIVLSPDGKHLYAAAEASQAVAAFSRNAGTGALTFIDAYFDGVDGVDCLGCTNNLAVSPDGNHLYAVGQFGASGTFCMTGFDDWMAIFSRDSGSGELTFISTLSPDTFNLPANCGGVAAGNGVIVSPDGQSVYATVQWRAALVELQRSAGSGLLTLTSFECADLFCFGPPLGATGQCNERSH